SSGWRSPHRDYFGLARSAAAGPAARDLGAADDPPAFAVDLIAAIGDHDGVGRFADHHVVALAVAHVDVVGFGGVVGAGVDDGRAAEVDDVIGPGAAIDRVFTLAAVDPVVAAAAEESVVAAAADQHVVAGEAAEFVAFAVAAHQVGVAAAFFEGGDDRRGDRRELLAFATVGAFFTFFDALLFFRFVHHFVAGAEDPLQRRVRAVEVDVLDHPLGVAEGQGVFAGVADDRRPVGHPADVKLGDLE